MRYKCTWKYVPHGYTKQLRLVNLPLPPALAVYAAYLWASSKVIGETNEYYGVG